MCFKENGSFFVDNKIELFTFTQLNYITLTIKYPKWAVVSVA